MIIGAIIETRSNGSTSDLYNGSSMLHFYNMLTALTWAQMQSRVTVEGGVTLDSTCTVINTDTNEEFVYKSGARIE